MNVRKENTKFAEEDRSFESRLLYIREIFSDVYAPEDIMAHCITHKLKRSYLRYVQTLDRSLARLTVAEPLKVLKNMDKEEE